MKVAYKPKGMSPNRPPNWRDERAARIAAQQAARRRPVEDDDDDAPPPAAARAERGPKAPARGRGAPWERVPVVVVGWAVLAVWWAVGGRYTIDGMPLLINAVLTFFRLPALLGPITDPHWYLYLGWLPFAISVIERRNRPRRGMAWNVTTVYTVFIWALVAAGDAGSTWLAVTNPDPDAWPLTHQVANISVLAGLWTLATTFAPEIGLAALWRYIRG